MCVCVFGCVYVSVYILCIDVYLAYILKSFIGLETDILQQHFCKPLETTTISHYQITVYDK